MVSHQGIFFTVSGKLARFLALAFGIVLAATIPVAAVNLDELTVVTLAQDGSWGVATAGSTGQAIAAAVQDCKAMTAAPTDCGAQFVTARGGWVVANLCGNHKIIVTAETREAAERAATVRETELKRLYVPDLAQCRRVLTVDPRGTVVPGQPTSERQIDARRQKR